jgi:hypothetical protein
MSCTVTKKLGYKPRPSRTALIFPVLVSNIIE